MTLQVVIDAKTDKNGKIHARSMHRGDRPTKAEVLQVVGIMETMKQNLLTKIKGMGEDDELEDDDEDEDD